MASDRMEWVDRYQSPEEIERLVGKFQACTLTGAEWTKGLPLRTRRNAEGR